MIFFEARPGGRDPPAAFLPAARPRGTTRPGAARRAQARWIMVGTDCLDIGPGKSTELNLAQILNSLPVAFMLLDGLGRVMEANHQLASLLGLSSQWLIGRHVSEFWPQTAPELERIAGSSRQATGLPLEELNGCFLQTVPLPNHDKGLAVTVLDRRLWQPLLDSAPLLDPLTPYYKKVFESSSDGISICDNEGRMILVNKASAAHVGLPADQLVGRHVDFLVKHHLIDNTVCIDVLSTKKAVTKLIRHHKTNKYILLTGNPIFAADGEVQLVVINERDLTGMIKLQSSFDRQSELLARYKDELTAAQLAELVSTDIVCSSNSMRIILDTALKLAGYSVREILITGESGTGKGLIAKFIHANSANSNEPFIHLNCAAMPETLLESELFGYEKATFTGASPHGRAGLFEAAGLGTVFLDEIGEMPVSIQAKLLTFLDNHEFRRVGGSKIITSPCNIIAATNRNLEELVAQKLFRQDLYYRLNVFCLHLPPLRERPEDVLELARRELQKLNSHYRQSRALDPLAIEVLQSYDFPGNVRELLNYLHQSVLLSPTPEIGAFLKSFLEGRDLGRRPAATDARPSRQGDWPPGGGPAPAAPVPPSPAPRPASEASPAPEQALPARLDDREKALLLEALTICGNTREMARFLGISQAGVSRKLKKHNLIPPGKRERLIHHPAIEPNMNQNSDDHAPGTNHHEI
jgi:PAS domain S-box-containing protein